MNHYGSSRSACGTLESGDEVTEELIDVECKECMIAIGYCPCDICNGDES